MKSINFNEIEAFFVAAIMILIGLIAFFLTRRLEKRKASLVVIHGSIVSENKFVSPLIEKPCAYYQTILITQWLRDVYRTELKLNSDSGISLETKELGNIDIDERTLVAGVLQSYGPYRRSKGPMGVGIFDSSVSERINDVMEKNSISSKLSFLPIPKLIIATEVVLCSGDQCLLTGKWSDETKKSLSPVRGYPFFQWQGPSGTEYLDQNREAAHAGYALLIIAIVGIIPLLLMYLLN